MVRGADNGCASLIRNMECILSGPEALEDFRYAKRRYTSVAVVFISDRQWGVLDLHQEKIEDLNKH